MPHKLSRRRSDEGFTLIELLVVILIIGILAAIAIPAFISQGAKANDASAKELARTAETVAETIGIDNGGSYTGVSLASIPGAEPTIATTPTTASAYLSAAGQAPTTAPGLPENTTINSYEVSVTAVRTGAVFRIIKNGDGTVVRTCVPASDAHRGGCPNGSTTSPGTW